jgi:membrane-anchored glycerophosphoryl diester phosphodiesterase (GDPDase)
MSESNTPIPYIPPSAASIPSAAGPSSFSSKTISQILDRTFRLTRSHFTLFVGIAAVPSALLLLVVAGLEAVFWIPMLRQLPNPPDPGVMLRSFTPAVIFPAIVVMMLLNLAIFSIYLAAASYAATQADLGVKVTFREAYGLAWQRRGSHLWLLTLCYLCAGLPLILIEVTVLVVGGLLMHSGMAANPALFLLIPLAALLYLAALVYGILMGLRLSLAFPACVTQGLTASAAIKRSFQLTRGAKGRIFLVILVIYALLYAGILVAELGAGLLALVGVLIAMVLHVHLQAPWSYVGIGLLGVFAFAAMILFISLTYASLMTALGVIYNDQRLRTDGLPAQPAGTGEAV